MSSITTPQKVKPKAPQPPVPTGVNPPALLKSEKLPSPTTDPDLREVQQQQQQPQQQVSEPSTSSSLSCQQNSDSAPGKSFADGQQKRKPPAPKPLATIVEKNAPSLTSTPPSSSNCASAKRAEHITLTVADGNHDSKYKQEPLQTPTDLAVATALHNSSNSSISNEPPADTSHVSIVTIDDNGKDVTIKTAWNADELDLLANSNNSISSNINSTGHRLPPCSSNVVGYSSPSLSSSQAASTTATGNKSLSGVTDDVVVLRTTHIAKEVIIVSSESSSKDSSSPSSSSNCRLQNKSYSETHQSSSTSCKLVNVASDAISNQSESSTEDVYPSPSSDGPNRIKVNLDVDHLFGKDSSVCKASSKVSEGKILDSSSSSSHQNSPAVNASDKISARNTEVKLTSSSSNCSSSNATTTTGASTGHTARNVSSFTNGLKYSQPQQAQHLHSQSPTAVSKKQQHQQQHHHHSRREESDAVSNGSFTSINSDKENNHLTCDTTTTVTNSSVTDATNRAPVLLRKKVSLYILLALTF